MNEAARIALLLAALLLSLPGRADEKDASAVRQDAAAAPSPTLERLLAESGYDARWQLNASVTAGLRASDWQPLADLEFQDATGLARVVKMRSLSFLTLASSGKARLFLGVNEEGLVGLHYRAISAARTSDYRELARMPYVSALAAEEAP